MAEHDAGYKALFSDKRIVADLIEGFVKERWVEQLDLETLERVSGSFVSEQFEKRENDVIWRIRFRRQWLYVYLLIEFQATVDRFMALRLLVYVGLLYQRLIDEKQIGRGELLPPVLPIVLYNGKEPWRAPRDVADLMAECPEELQRYQPRMQYFLLEEHARRDAELAGMENLAALVFRFEKCRKREDFEEAVAALGRWARAPEHRESIKRLIRWIDGVLWPDRLPDDSVLDVDDIRECGAMLKEQVREWEKAAIQKGIQQGIEKGIQQGIEKGIEKGIKKGIEKGEAGVLVRLLENRFGALSDEVRQRIDQAGSEQLLIWAERVLTAEQLDDVFESR